MHEAAGERRGARKRAIPLVAGGLIALAAMFQLVSSNVLAVNFTTQNNTFNLYSNYLDAFQAAGFLDATSRAGSQVTCPGASSATTQCGVAELGINTAKLAGLCAINNESLPLVGSYSLMIRAGQGVAKSFTGTGIPSPTSGTLVTNTGSGPNDGTIDLAHSTGIIQANQLYVNSNSLSGYGNLISGLNLGENATQVGGDAGVSAGFATSGNQAPTAGNFGLYAKQLNVAGLNASTYGLNLAGQITLPNLSISVVPGSKAQADC